MPAKEILPDDASGGSMTEIRQLMMSQGHRIPIHQRGKAVTAMWLEIQIRIPATPVT